MTETTTFPFTALDEDSTDEKDRKSLAVVLGGGLLAVALIGGAVFAFTGGDEELPVEAGVSRTAGAANAAPPAEAELALVVPAANTESIARNPFEPKYVEPAPVPEPPPVQPVEVPVGLPVAVPPSVVTPVDVADYEYGSGPAPGAMLPPAWTPTAPQAPPSEAPQEYRLVLTGVTVEDGVPTAQFTIDGAVSAVKATEIFGPNRQLLLRSLQQGPKDGQWTATIQVGDARPFDVVTNEAVFVR